MHDHRWCPVVGVVAERVAAGAESWGTPHLLPALESAEQAARVRQGLFRGRDCAELRKQHGQLSVSVKFRAPGGAESDKPVPGPGGYRLVLRVWTRDAAKAEIARRVGRGERLTYNVMRDNP